MNTERRSCQYYLREIVKGQYGEQTALNYMPGMDLVQQSGNKDEIEYTFKQFFVCIYIRMYMSVCVCGQIGCLEI